MDLEWFKRRPYRHFDKPVCEAFATRAMDPAFVGGPNYQPGPLLHYVKEEKRYKHCDKAGKRVLKTKKRPIKYASHRDACVLSRYSYDLSQKLDAHYEAAGLSDEVIAYRSLGKGNYHFAAEALAFAKANGPVTILAFDVTGFFDNLDHVLLKGRLKRILGVDELPADWFKVFRQMTRFSFVDSNELKASPTFGPRLKLRNRDPIATISELKMAAIRFYRNPGLSSKPGRSIGIPQGTPISATFSNLYMIDYDAAASQFCDGIGAFYRRYSDDILVICRNEDAPVVEAEMVRLMDLERLQLNPDKIERTAFVPGGSVAAGHGAQYLGFNLGPFGATIRHSSMSRQWRKMRRAFKRTRKVAVANIAAGIADKAWTKRLRRRFTARPVRNFSSYARRSAAAFGPDEKITGQLRRFERAVERELAELQKL
ncbi:reverse transcriptase domain-containing protein [uncultured Jannaschia sp.]|uniref:reverse transcriptase domain-containing protein n=1 Tax=uncultured Jannaschia sp. TaxID=293347 RepID=UPI002613EC3D|nr:reverse transcriptase domain-containing protein [uncultured Jannaschia sp.]